MCERWLSGGSVTSDGLDQFSAVLLKMAYSHKVEHTARALVMLFGP